MKKKISQYEKVALHYKNNFPLHHEQFFVLDFEHHQRFDENQGERDFYSTIYIYMYI